MKENIVLITFVLIFTFITTPLINNVIKKPIRIESNIQNIAIADNFWDYISRFSINN